MPPAPNSPDPSSHEPDSPEPNSPGTWTSLLAQALHLAQASVAFPKTLEGDRFRAAVPAIISLQALTLALQGINQLDCSERGIGIDRATVLLSKHAAELHTLWRGQELPDTIAELLADTRLAIRDASQCGVLIVVTVAPLSLPQPQRIAQTLLEAGFIGTLWLAGPGVVIGPDSPIAFIRGPRGGTPPAEMLDLLTSALAAEAGQPQNIPVSPVFQRIPVPRPLQVYRSREAAPGAAAGQSTELVDTLAWFDDELPAGRPLLSPIIDGQTVLAAPNPVLFTGLDVPAARVRGNPADAGTSH